MGAIAAFSTAVGILERNRALLGVALVATVVNFGLASVTAVLPQPTAGLASLPLTGITYLVMPFFIGGMLAMADEGLDGVTRFDTFVAAGKANYLRLLVSMVLFGVAIGVLAFAVVIGVAVIGVFAIGVNATGAGSPMATMGGGLATIAVLGLVGFLLVMVPVFFLQFYAPAIVVSDLGVVESFKRSAGLVRRNLLSTLGYTAIVSLVGVVAGLAGAIVSTLGGLYGNGAEMTGALPDLGVGVLAVAAVVALVLTTLVSAFGVAYQVSFYTDRLDSLA